MPISVSSHIKSLMQSINQATSQGVLGLGTLATQSGTFSGTSSGTNTGDQTNITGNAGTVTTINGRISSGANVTITGSGTAASPYIIASSGGGGGGGGGVDEGADYIWLGSHNYVDATVAFGSLTVETIILSKLSVSATLSTDLTYNGKNIRSINAGDTISILQAVYYDFAAGEWLLADANGASTYPSQGLAAAASTNGNALTVITEGFVRNDAWNWVAGPIYLSTTAGGLTQTAPSTIGDKVQVVGWSVTADKAYFHFNPFWATVS